MCNLLRCMICLICFFFVFFIFFIFYFFYLCKKSLISYRYMVIHLDLDISIYLRLD